MDRRSHKNRSTPISKSTLYPSTMGPLLTRHQISPAEEPFRTFYRRVVSAWIARVLGPKPPDVMQDLSPVATKLSRCGCADCRKVVSFLVRKPDLKVMLPNVGAKVANHLDKQMTGSRAASCRIVKTTPRSFEVKCPPVIDPTAPP